MPIADRRPCMKKPARKRALMGLAVVVAVAPAPLRRIAVGALVKAAPVAAAAGRAILAAALPLA